MGGGRAAGIAAAVGAYVLWGFFPLYWALLRGAPAHEVLLHRIVWSFLFVGGWLALAGRLGEVRALDRRQVLLLLAAGGLIASNWLAYIWGVMNGHVVETSLGYFINPLVTVALGVFALGERLRRAQAAAVAIAGVAVLVVAGAHGRPPLLALWLAGSFALYGLVKKKAGVKALPSLFVETALVTTPALLGLGALFARGEATFLALGPGHTTLLVLAGAVTAIPLVLFGVAANAVPLGTLGPLQYISPSLQFLCGVLVFGEPMPAARWVGFALVWVALLVFTLDSLRTRPDDAPAAVTPPPDRTPAPASGPARPA